MIFSLFLLVPSTSAIPPENAVRELETILARPAFAGIGLGYFDRKAKGAKFVARNREWWFQSYNPGIRFARPSGRIASLERYESEFPLHSEVSIAIYEDPDSPKRDEYGALEGVHRPIPQLQMIFDDSENGDRREIRVDAVTGRVSVSDLVQPFGRSSLRSAPLPTKVACGKITGTLIALPSSGTPSGVAAFVHEADRYFAGRYETKTGTLWLQRTKREPYRAFRPDAKLRKALAEQVKRTEKMTKNQPR